MVQKVNVVKFKLLYFNSIAPKRAHDTDAGFDVYANSCEYNEVNDCYIYGTGIAVEMPDNLFCDARARSSSYTTDCYSPYGVGTIDTGYRGEIKFIYKPRTSNMLVVELNKLLHKIFGTKLRESVPPFELGEKIGQLIFLYKPSVIMAEVDRLEDSDRGEEGFGSTGRD